MWGLIRRSKASFAIGPRAASTVSPPTLLEDCAVDEAAPLLECREKNGQRADVGYRPLVSLRLLKPREDGARKHDGSGFLVAGTTREHGCMRLL